MYRVELYSAAKSREWNDFVARSKNGTFLFNRGFMEYHANRFTDFSLMVYDGQKLVALLPANRVGDVVHSHQGLTYGGLILEGSIGAEKVEHILNEVLYFLDKENVATLKLKQLIAIYQKEPSFETDYMLFKKGAKLYRRDMNLAIDFSRNLAVSKSKMKHFRRIDTLGLEIRQNNDFDAFWDAVLIPRLAQKHNAKPVHSKEEIKSLHSKFPDAIVQYNVYYQNEIIAGITLFVFDNVVKSQYGATTATGEKLRALDYLFISLIESYKDKMHYFDMGTVTENESYNKGLLKQKEELGCRVFTQDFYEVATANHSLLNNVLI